MITDKKKIKSIENITMSLHDEIDNVHESLMENDFKAAREAIDTAVESLKHIKSNLKKDAI